MVFSETINGEFSQADADRPCSGSFTNCQVINMPANSYGFFIDVPKLVTVNGCTVEASSTTGTRGFRIGGGSIDTNSLGMFTGCAAYGCALGILSSMSSSGQAVASSCIFRDCTLSTSGSITLFNTSTS